MTAGYDDNNVAADTRAYRRLLPVGEYHHWLAGDSQYAAIVRGINNVILLMRVALAKLERKYRHHAHGIG